MQCIIGDLSVNFISVFKVAIFQNYLAIFEDSFISLVP